MAGPFKMKAGKKGPMYKNFPSTFKDVEDKKVVKGGVTPTVDVSGGDKTERYADKYKRVKEETKGNDKAITAKFAKEYGGTWTKVGTVYRNQDGQSVKEAAIAQGQKKSKEKRDYIAKNTTK